jgi:hypothetical protein
MGNGNQEGTGVIGDVEGLVKSAEGEQLVRIIDTMLLKNGQFNLFCITQMLTKGWSTEGMADEIIIKKGTMKI